MSMESNYKFYNFHLTQTIDIYYRFIQTVANLFTTVSPYIFMWMALQCECDQGFIWIAIIDFYLYY